MRPSAREVSPAEADQMRGTVQRDVIGLLLALVDGKVGGDAAA